MVAPGPAHPLRIIGLGLMAGALSVACGGASETATGGLTSSSGGGGGAASSSQASGPTGSGGAMVVDKDGDGLGFLTGANGWTEPTLLHFNPWDPAKNFGGAGNVAGDLVDPAFVPPACP
jgi:hypothetical protein